MHFLGKTQPKPQVGTKRIAGFLSFGGKGDRNRVVTDKP